MRWRCRVAQVRAVAIFVQASTAPYHSTMHCTSHQRYITTTQTVKDTCPHVTPPRYTAAATRRARNLIVFVTSQDGQASSCARRARWPRFAPAFGEEILTQPMLRPEGQREARQIGTAHLILHALIASRRWRCLYAAHDVLGAVCRLLLVGFRVSSPSCCFLSIFNILFSRRCISYHCIGEKTSGRTLEDMATTW